MDEQVNSGGGKFPTSTILISVGILISFFLFTKQLFGNSDIPKSEIPQSAFNKIKNVLGKYKADTTFKALVNRYSRKLNMPDASAFLLAWIAQENENVDPSAIGDNGHSYGLLQVQEDIANSYGFPLTAMLEPENNLAVATQYLKDYYSETKDWYRALRKYNGGPNGEQKSATVAYADSVYQNYQAIRMSK